MPNGSMVLMELTMGWQGESMGLVADGLDMGADAAVYLLALLAFGAVPLAKIRALVANVICLALLRATVRAACC